MGHPQGEGNAVTLVIASCGSPLDWIKPLLAKPAGLLVHAVVQEQCGRRPDLARVRCTVNRVPRCGRESASYLHYLTRNWDALPLHMIFMQGDAPRHWRGAQLAGDGSSAFRAMLELVNGPANFRMLAGYFSSSTCTHAGNGVRHIWRRLMGRSTGVFANQTMPTMTSFTYAHFYLRRDRVAVGYPLSVFVALLDLHRRGHASQDGSQPLNWTNKSNECPHSKYVGLGFERMWPTIFGCSEPIPAAMQLMKTDGEEEGCVAYRNLYHEGSGHRRCLVQAEGSICNGCAKMWHVARGADPDAWTLEEWFRFTGR